MFEQIFRRSSCVTRHAEAPYASERERYLMECARRGDSKIAIRQKAEELYWVASKLSVYGDLRLSPNQIRAAAFDCDWRDRERASGRKINRGLIRRRFISCAGLWLRHLGYLQEKPPSGPFQQQLDRFCRWAADERGLTDATVNQYRKCLRQFLRWYQNLDRELTEVRIQDIDAYLAYGGTRGWQRVTVSNMACALRTFFRYAATQGWVRSTLAAGIYAPPIYAFEKLPAGPAWTDVRRMFAGLKDSRPKDIRDRAILMLFAIYGLREIEVARLRLENLDWEHDLLHVSRAKGRGTQTYPLLPSVGNAIILYLQLVRQQSSVHREVFLTIRSPFTPISGAGLYYVAATRLMALGVHTAHHGPHSLRHACATRLVAEGLSLKEIGDQLGHRTSSATRAYAKVDLAGLREVAAFDLGALR